MLQALGPFGSFLLLARLAPAKELGQYSLAVAIVVPLFLVARMQLRQAAVADPHGAGSFGSYRSLRIVSATCALVVSGGLAAKLDASFGAVLCALAFVRWAEDVGDIHYAPLQRASLWPRIVVSQLIRVTGTLGCLFFGWEPLGLPLALACVGLWQCLVTVVLDMRLAGSLEQGAFAWNGLGKLLRLNWALGGTAAIISLLSYTPRYALAWAQGASDVGDYAALGQVALLGNLVIQGAGQASLARLGTSFVSDRSQFAQIVRELLLLSAGVALVGIAGAVIWGDTVLAFVFQPRFGALSAELVGMMTASLFVYVTSVFGYALTAAGVKRSQLIVFGTALVFGAGTAYPMSATYGIGGAVGSTVVCWAVAAGLSATLFVRVFRVRSSHAAMSVSELDRGGAV